MSEASRYQVAVLGYGNQGRAHALNLRDSGVHVSVGARPGKGWDQAVADGFSPSSFTEAVRGADIAVFLLPDTVIGGVYDSLSSQLAAQRTTVGFAHGYAVRFGHVVPMSECDYFLVGPKGAGAVLRTTYSRGDSLPGVWALGGRRTQEGKNRCHWYASQIGVGRKFFAETTFEEETETDLFGEQAVLCGGLLELMEGAFQVLVEQGVSEDMAFFECCYEARMILELWMQHGPTELRKRISPTAFYGGATRAHRVLSPDLKERLQSIWNEIHSGEFSREWESGEHSPVLQEKVEQLSQSRLETTYRRLKDYL